MIQSSLTCKDSRKMKRRRMPAWTNLPWLLDSAHSRSLLSLGRISRNRSWVADVSSGSRSKHTEASSKWNWRTRQPERTTASWRRPVNTPAVRAARNSNFRRSENQFAESSLFTYRIHTAALVDRILVVRFQLIEWDDLHEKQGVFSIATDDYIARVIFTW